jgi:hypothetical protein
MNVRQPETFDLVYLAAFLSGDAKAISSPYRYHINRRGKYLRVRSENPVTGEFFVPRQKAQAHLEARLRSYTSAGLPTKAAIWAASRNLRVEIVPEGTTVTVKDGSSYFGSGGYSAGLRTNVPVDRQKIERWDNGCAAGRAVTVTLKAGEYAGHSGGDGIGGGRTLAKTIFVAR